MTVGERIKQQREFVGLSQDELAKKMGYKDRSSISKIEKESDKNLSLDIVQKAAAALNCSPLILMGWNNNKNSGSDVRLEYENKLNDQNERTERFIQLYNCLDEYQQKLVDNLLENLASK